MTQLGHPKASRDAGHRYLPADHAARLQRLAFERARPASARRDGRHHAHRTGQSGEFHDYRPYLPGDPVRDIDWKVFARTDRLFRKLYDRHAEASTRLLVDASASMAYRGATLANPTSPSTTRRARLRRLLRFPHAAAARHARTAETPTPTPTTTTTDNPSLHDTPSKYDLACLLAAGLAFLTDAQRDPLGLAFARDGLLDALTPARDPRRLSASLDAMAQTRPEGRARLDAAIDALASHRRRPERLVVLSDLAEPKEPILAALQRFAHAAAEVALFHVTHPDEWRLPDGCDGPLRLIDSESGEAIDVDPETIRDAQHARQRAEVDAWRDACRRRGFAYELASTDEPCIEPLRRALRVQTDPYGRPGRAGRAGRFAPVCSTREGSR